MKTPKLRFSQHKLKRCMSPRPKHSVYMKHGPRGEGGPGPCDRDCGKCFAQSYEQGRCGELLEYNPLRGPVLCTRKRGHPLSITSSEDERHCATGKEDK